MPGRAVVFNDNAGLHVGDRVILKDIEKARIDFSIHVQRVIRDACVQIDHRIGIHDDIEAATPKLKSCGCGVRYTLALQRILIDHHSVEDHSQADNAGGIWSDLPRARER